MISFKDNGLASENNYDRDFKTNPLTGMTNVFSTICNFLVISIYRWDDGQIVHNNTRQFIHVKPEMSRFKLWPVGGRGGHCFDYKDHDHNNCMAHYEQVLGTEALDLLDPHTCYNCALSQILHAGWPFSLCMLVLSEQCLMTFDDACHILVKWKK